MPPFNITLVAGSSGVGKTTWIRQQVQAIADSALYLNLGAHAGSVDSTYLAAEVPGLQVLSITQLADFLAHPIPGAAIYLELGFHIDLTSLILPDQTADCRRVAVLPPRTCHTDWHDWADLIVTGTEAKFTLQHPHLWRSALSGQVLEPASLNTFWYELTHGAYGVVQRAKGIFDVVDGRSLYFDFVAGLPATPHLELNLPLCLNGRPDRFSGIEVVGERLDQAAIAQTIKECCLEDHVIAYYQKQMRELVGSGE